jgi:hypothetical protein
LIPSLALIFDLLAAVRSRLLKSGRYRIRTFAPTYGLNGFWKRR